SGEGLQRAAAEVLLRSEVWGDLRIPVNSVSAVRLQAEMPGFAEQWGTFQQRKSEKDLLIVVKRDGSGLDFLSGIVSAIGSEDVEFLLDGEKVPVPAARVYGVVFGRSENTGAVSAGGVRVLLANGDVLRGRELRLADDRLQLQGSWGQSLQCEAGKLRLADLSGERLSYLS
ncbi:MAG: hypothetical protein ACKPHU_27420, partial [Planctomycetaceae bacterium]